MARPPLGAAGKLLVKKKFTQRQLLAYSANMQTSLIGLEACSGAHFLGQALRKQGHDVRLIAAQFVKPFVKSNKNDFVDAEAIAEAVERKNMRFVPIKTDDQLDLQAIHRVRDRLVSRRTAVINQLRAFLLERGKWHRIHAGLGEGILQTQIVLEKIVGTNHRVGQIEVPQRALQRELGTEVWNILEANAHVQRQPRQCAPVVLEVAARR
jgi:Transposase